MVGNEWTKLEDLRRRLNRYYMSQAEFIVWQSERIKRLKGENIVRFGEKKS